MKHIVLTSLALLALIGSRAPAQSIIHSSLTATPLRLSVRPDSRLWLEGSSNVRDWRCNAISLDAAIDVDDRALRVGGVSSVRRVRHVQVRVPTHALTCGRSQMDNIMYKALHVDDEPDCQQIVGRLPVTIMLAVGAGVIWLLIGIPIGIVSAIRPRTATDRAGMLFALFGVSAPVFWLAYVLLYVFWFKLHIREPHRRQVRSARRPAGNRRHRRRR